MRSRDNVGGTSFWDITLPRGTYLVTVSIVGQLDFSGEDQALVHIGLSTDDTTDDGTGLIVNSMMQLQAGGAANGQEAFFTGTHAYLQAVSSGGQTFTVKRTISEVNDANVTSSSALSKLSVGKSVDGVVADGSVIRAYRIGQ